MCVARARVCGVSVCVYQAMDAATSNSNARGKTKRVRTDTTVTMPSETNTTSKQPRKSPTRAALDALEQQLESLPDNLAELAKYFGNNLIRLRAKLFNKIAVSKRMEDDADYIPKSARTSNFEISTSKAAAEKNSERIEILQQQIDQAKDIYQKSLKSVIQECAAFEIDALETEEDNLVMEILEKTAVATNTADNNACDVHLKVNNVIRLKPSLFRHGISTTKDEVRESYKAYHQLETLPEPTVRLVGNDHRTQESLHAAQALAATSMQRPENKGIQTYCKLLETILVTPSAAFYNQHESNKKEIALKKVITEVIEGKVTEETAMEIETETSADMVQLQTLIQKECDKRDKKYKDLEQKYSNLQRDIKSMQSKNGQQGGSPSAPTNQNKNGNGKKKPGNNGKQNRGRQRSSSQPNRRKNSQTRNKPENRGREKADDDSSASGNDNSKKKGNKSRRQSRSRKKRSGTKNNRQST